MPISLYNDKNVINDLLHAAHPMGGNPIIDVPSPSGGEGVVETEIEHQLIVLKQVYRDAVGRTIADLAVDVEKPACQLWPKTYVRWL